MGKPHSSIMLGVNTGMIIVMNDKRKVYRFKLALCCAGRMLGTRVFLELLESLGQIWRGQDVQATWLAYL